MGGGEGEQVPHSQKSCPTLAHPNEMTLCTGVYGEQSFRVLVSTTPHAPLLPPHFEKSGLVSLCYCNRPCICNMPLKLLGSHFTTGICLRRTLLALKCSFLMPSALAALSVNNTKPSLCLRQTLLALKHSFRSSRLRCSLPCP